MYMSKLGLFSLVSAKTQLLQLRPPIMISLPGRKTALLPSHLSKGSLLYSQI